MRAATQSATKPVAKRIKTVQYVEGDSSADEANGIPDGDADSDIETEEGDDLGSVEDVELGSDSDEEDEEDELNESEDGHEGMNGFIDNEAEESIDDDEEESDDESEEDDESE